MGRDQPVGQRAEPRHPLRRGGAVQAGHRFPLHHALRHVQAHRHRQIGRRRHGAGQQGLRAGFHPVGRQHPLHQTAEPARLRSDKAYGIVQPGQPPRLVKAGFQHARRRADHAARPVGWPQPDPQAQIDRRLCRRLELGHRLAPCAVEQRRDGQGRSDAVAQQLRKDEPFLERQFLGRIHLVGATVDIALRPDPALGPGRAAIDAQHGGIKVRQRVKVDEPGRDQHLAQVEPPRHLAGKAGADIQDAVTCDHHFAVFQQAVSAARVRDDPAGGKGGAACGAGAKGQGFQHLRAPLSAIGRCAR
jgi:hypothetical protein